MTNGLQRVCAVLVIVAAAPTTAGAEEGYRAPGLQHVHASAVFPPSHARCMKFIDDYLAWVKEGIDRGTKLPFTSGILATTYRQLSGRDRGLPPRSDVAGMLQKAQRDLPEAKRKLQAQQAELQRTRNRLKSAKGPARHERQQALDTGESVAVRYESGVRENEAKAGFAKCAMDNMGG